VNDVYAIRLFSISGFIAHPHLGFSELDGRQQTALPMRDIAAFAETSARTPVANPYATVSSGWPTHHGVLAPSSQQLISDLL
jgi:hypothetical protein